MLVLEAIPFLSVAPLLEWAPKVLVADTALEEVISWGIKIDVVFIQETFHDRCMALLGDQLPVATVTYEGIEDLSGKALDFLKQCNEHAVQIVVQKDVDKWMNFFSDPGALHVTIHQESKRWLQIREKQFRKWVAAGTSFGIHDRSGAFEVQGLRRVEGRFTAPNDGIIAILSMQPFWV